MIDLNLRKKKWLICCFDKPQKNLRNYHLQELAKRIQINSNNYDDTLLLGDFNAQVSGSRLTTDSWLSCN